MSEAKEVGIILLRDPSFIVPIAEGMVHMKQLTTNFHGRRSKKTNRIIKKT